MELHCTYDPETRGGNAPDGRNPLMQYFLGGGICTRNPLCNEFGAGQARLGVGENMGAHAMFEVVFFNEHVWPWRGRLSHADPLTKELLLRHIPTMEVKSYTNLFDAMETALDLRVEEMFVITDGEPNRGRRQFPRDILKELKKLNLGRTVIHTISVVRTVDGDDHVALLKSIAEAHGGRHVARTLK